MIKISDYIPISVVTKILILLVAAKSISLAIWWYLPSDGVELVTKSNYQPKYQRVDFNIMIGRAAEVKNENLDQSSSASGISMTNIILKGLYGTKTKGFVVVAMRSDPARTSIVSIEEIYMGYKLKSITKQSAVFQKGGKNYILNFDTVKNSAAVSYVNIEEVYDGPRGVTREEIAHYAKNPKQIWKEISIKELKDGEELKGFEVTNIMPDSKFAMLGLKKGDIIIKANNIKILSYRDALEIYKNIDKFDTIQVVVIRDKKEKELIYDIN